MSNNFNYLEYMNTNTGSRRTNNGYSSNRYNNGNQRKKSESLREFEREVVTKPQLQHFRNVFMDLLVKDYEQPFSRELEMIKRKRGEEEYKQDVKRIYESLGKLRESAEATLMDVKRYLDYVEVKEEKGNARLYLPGLEEKTKLDKIKLPDLLGFTRSDTKKDQYGSFILGMVRTFLGFEGQSLWKAMEYLTEEIDKLKDFRGMDVGLCDKFVREPVLLPLYRITAYYNLLRMMEKGEFDINRFLGQRKDREDDFGRRDRDYRRREDRRRDKKKSKKRRSLFSGGGKPKPRPRPKPRSSSLKGDIRLVEDRGEKVDDKIEYVLLRERNMERKGNNRDRKSVNEIMDKLKRSLRSTGISIFCKNTGINFEYFKNIKDYNKVEELSKIGDNTAKDLRSNSEDIYRMGSQSLSENEVVIRDFYTNKSRYLVKSGDTLKANRGEIPDDKKIVYIVVRSYYELYEKYTFGNLPMSDDSPLNTLKNAVLILNGLAIYLNVLREMIILLEKKLMEDIVVKKLEESKKEEKEKKEKMEEELKMGKGRYLQYREILRELDRQILVEKNKNKLNRLMKLKNNVLSKSGQ